MKARTAWKSAAQDTLRVSFWGLVVYLGVNVIALIFRQNATGALGAQFVLAEFGLGRLGVVWSDPHAPLPTTRDIVRRALVGSRYGATAAAALILVGLATHQIEREVGTPSLTTAGLGALIAAATAARDELILRGMPLRALALTRKNLGTPGEALALVVVGLLTAASRWGAGAHAMEISMSACAGVALGALWIRDGGAWMAWGANLAFTWISGALVRGGLIDLRAQGESGDIASTRSALAVSLVFAALGAFVVLRPRPSP